MKKALHYLWSTYIINILGSSALIAAAATVLSQVLRIEALSMYYDLLPMFNVVFSLVYGFSLTTIYRQNALCCNCRRKDFFWGCQAGFVICAAIYTATAFLAGWLPRLLPGGYAPSGLDEILAGGPPVWASGPAMACMAAVYLLLQPVGAAMGYLYGRSKVWGALCSVVAMILGCGGTTVALFVMDGTSPLPRTALGVVLAALGALALVCQVCFYRSNRKSVVR